MVEPIACINCGRPISNIYEAFKLMLADIPPPQNKEDLTMPKQLEDLYYIFGMTPSDHHCTMTIMTSVKHADFIVPGMR